MDVTQSIRKLMRENGLMFLYRGMVTDANSDALLMMLEQEMNSSGVASSGRKRVFMFVLESLQNITRHGMHNNLGKLSLVMYGRQPNGYSVCTGNVIRKEEVGKLKEKLEHLNKLSDEEVRSFYRETIATTGFSEKGGAGLGLIEMARKTGSKIDYSFSDVDEEHTYYYLSKYVDNRGRTPDDESRHFTPEVIQLAREQMEQENLFMVYYGHISDEVADNVLNLTEDRLSDEESSGNVRKRTFSIMVECIQNIYNYSPCRKSSEKLGMPIVIIRFMDHSYQVISGNLVEVQDVGNIKNRIDRINALSKKELKEEFRAFLKQSEEATEAVAGLGFLNIARKSGQKIAYHFDQLDERYAYYVQTVNVPEEL